MLSPEVIRCMRNDLHDSIQKLEAVDKNLERMERPSKSNAEYMLDTFKANVDNQKLSDADFRDFVRQCLK